MGTGIKNRKRHSPCFKELCVFLKNGTGINIVSGTVTALTQQNVLV